jgi:hypothetical protein
MFLNKRPDDGCLKTVKVMSLGRINLGKNGNKYIWGCEWVKDDV